MAANKNKRLRHIPTGRIFTWNENLAKRKDMERFDQVPAERKKISEPVPQEPDPAEETTQEPSIADMAGMVLGRGKKAPKE